MLCLISLFIVNVNFAAVAATHKNSVEIVKVDDLEAWIAYNQSLPIILLNLEFIGAGAIAENKAGIAELLGNMFTEGASDYDYIAYNKELDKYAIQISAVAGRDNFTIQLKTLSENLPRALKLLEAALHELRLDAGDLERIKTEHLSALKLKQANPNFHMSELFYSNVFAGTKYATLPYGDEASIKSITAMDLREFMKANLRRDNLKISLAGDINSENIRKNLMPILLKLPKSDAEKNQAQPIILQAQKEILQHKMPNPQSSIMIVYNGIKRSDPLFYAAYILQHIVGGGSLSSKLGIELREKNGLVYGVSAGFEELQYANWFAVNFATKTESTSHAIKLAKKVIQDAANGNIAQAELQEAKDYLTGSFAINLNSNAQRLGYVAMMQRNNLPVDYLEKRNQLLAEVSLKQIKQVAKILSGQPLATLIVGE
jgi:zinc protease